jgi:hypothetical protein
MSSNTTLTNIYNNDRYNYNLLKAKTELNYYNLNNKFISEIAILFPEQETVISSLSQYEMREFFNIYTNLKYHDPENYSKELRSTENLREHIEKQG